MYDFGWEAWAVLALAAFFSGAAKTGLPGLGILGILITARVIPAMTSTGLILPMLIVGDIFAVAYYHRHAVWAHLVKLMPVAAAGIVLGGLALWRMGSENPKADHQLRIFIGSVILAMLALNWWRSRRGAVAIPSGPWFPICMGLIAGVTTMMANAAGPVLVIYLLAMRLPKNEFLGTGAWYYLILNWIKVPFSVSLGLINWHSLQINLVLLPLIVAGALAGIRLVKYVPEKTFTVIVQWLAVAAAAALLF